MARPKPIPLMVQCQHCRKPMLIPPYKLKHGQGKFCSMSCKSKANVHKVHALRTPEWNNISTKNIEIWHKRMRDDPTECYNWKGDTASYRTKHQWIQNRYGKPKQCELCGLSDKSRMYHWANISGKYIRDRSDYKRMCVPCHSKFDLSRNENDRRRKRERVRA